MTKILRSLMVVSSLLFSTHVAADKHTVFELTAKQPMDVVYANMKTSFDDSRFYIFYEMNIGKNLAYFAETWGDEYNKNNVSAVRSIVFCNGWFLNKAANKDFKLLGLCPMHINLLEKDGMTSALFVRPTTVYKNSAAYDTVEKIEEEVIELIKNAMKAK